MANTHSKRIEARIKPETLILVQRAAEMRGSSVSDLVVSAAEGAARNLPRYPSVPVARIGAGLRFQQAQQGAGFNRRMSISTETRISA